MPARAPRNPFDRGHLARGAEARSPLSPFAPPRTARLPAVTRPRILVHGPRALQVSLGTASRPTVPYPPPPPANSVPGWRGGSTPEWACFWALWQRLKLVPEVEFEHQGTFAGGRNLPGGFVPDFVVFIASTALGIQGEYIHYEQGSGQQALDRAQAAVLGKYALRMIWIDAADATRDPEFYCREALAGFDHSIGAQGVV